MTVAMFLRFLINIWQYFEKCIKLVYNIEDEGCEYIYRNANRRSGFMRGRNMLLLLALPAALYAGIVKQDYVFSAPVIDGDAVTMQGCHPFYMAYAPFVPAKSVRLLLPDGEKAVSYKVSYDGTVTVSGRYAIRPYRPEIRIGSRPPRDYYTRKVSAYLINREFPLKVQSEAFEMQYKGGHPIFMAQIYPVQYNPVSGTVRYFKKMTVTVQTAPANEKPTVYNATPVVKDELARLVDNPAGIAKLTAGPVTANDYEYLIITTNTLSTAAGFTNFIAFNKRRGMRTKIATIETIRTSMTGADDQEKIRAYVKQEYANCNIKYVLLGGDAEATAGNRIPWRGLYSEDWDYNYTGAAQDHYTDNIPADMYYGCLDAAPNDWHAVGGRWGTYGTEDKTFEVYVGRWCLDNTTDLNNIVNKTITYSESPVDSLCKRVLFAGEYLWGPPNHPATCYGNDELEQIINTCTSPSYAPYTTVGFPTAGTNAFTITKLYDYSTSGSWGATQFINGLKTSKASIILHEGHSNANYLFRMSNSSVTTANFSQACTPATGNYLIATSGGCYPGAFDNNNVGTITTTDCFAEQLTTKLATGAVAVIFNSRYGFGSDGRNGVIGTDGSEQRLRRYFWSGLFSLGYHNLGRLDAYCKEVNADGWTNSTIVGTAGYVSYWGQLKWETYEKNILGDPALSVWTAQPQTLSPILPSPLTTTTITLAVPKFSVVAIATATDSIITSVTSGNAGTVTINNTVLTAYLQTHPQATLHVIIKAHNYRPYNGTMTVNIGTGIVGNAAEGAVFSFRMLPQGIIFSCATPAAVSLGVYNARGVLVRALAEGTTSTGEHTVSFDNLGLSRGMYFCRLRTAGMEYFTSQFIIAR